MYCKNCGNKIEDGSMFCSKCGASISNEVKTSEVKATSTTKTNVPVVETSKLGLGIIFALFLGLIGLVIGLLLYKPDTYERKTFMKGWIWTFVCAIILGFIIGVALGLSDPSTVY